MQEPQEQAEYEAPEPAEAGDSTEPALGFLGPHRDGLAGFHHGWW
ncbi:hypothetical protein QOM21_22595 [Streptomyces sp. Pv4-95]